MGKWHQKSHAFLCIFMLLAGVAGAGEEGVAKNAILFIGDGMGPAAVTAGRLFTGGSTGLLAMEQLGVSGFSRTYSANQFVTDSAAGGTALASGIKSYNGAIGVSDPATDPSGKSRHVQSLADLALAQGKSVGIVTTSRVTHATPACFYAHMDSRNLEPDIAAQAVGKGLTVLMGGGRSMFHGKAWKDPESGKAGQRKDGRDLVREMKAAGFTCVESEKEFKAVDPKKPGVKLLGLFEFDHMDYALDRAEDKLGEPSLAEMVDCAIKILAQNPKGYFLMVEGAKIDMAAHGNDARNLVNEVAALDKAVGTAVKTAGPETLIVVTADHDTGGMAVNGYGERTAIKGEALLGNMAAGKVSSGSEIVSNSGTRGFISFGSGPGAKSTDAVDPAAKKFKYKAAYDVKGSAAHSAVDVPVMAGGPGAMLLTGYQNNNEIAWKIAKAMGTAFSDPANVENRNAVK